MRQYVRLHAWDFLLTVLIAIGMHLNTFSAFMIRESYMTNYLLVTVVTTLVMAVMFVIGYNKRNTIIGGRKPAHSAGPRYAASPDDSWSRRSLPVSVVSHHPKGGAACGGLAGFPKRCYTGSPTCGSRFA